MRLKLVEVFTARRLGPRPPVRWNLIRSVHVGYRVDCGAGTALVLLCEVRLNPQAGLSYIYAPGIWGFHPDEDLAAIEILAEFNGVLVLIPALHPERMAPVKSLPAALPLASKLGC